MSKVRKPNTKKARKDASAHTQITLKNAIRKSLKRTFFMIPALRFEKVMCLLDLS